MAGVRIVSDSSCDLTRAEAEELGVTLVPLSIRFGDDEFADGETISVEEFYKKMAAAEDLPQTSAPSPGLFAQAFTAARDDGADAVVCLTLSSALSATMEAAEQGAKTLDGDFPVHIVDSESITSGFGTLVVEAANAAKAGSSADEIIAMVKDLSARTHVFGALNTLENLKKGGRINGARAMLGSMLSIKPIVDISTGVVEEAGKQRTRKKSLVWLHEKMLEKPIEKVAVYHGEAPDIEEFLAMIAADFPRDTLRIGKIGPVIGTHGGPEIMGVTWVDKAP